jgi:hypothetical protein
VERSGSELSLEELVREHAALQRVAVLVAREPGPAEVFEAVAREVGTLLGARRAQLVRLLSPEEGMVAASWSDGTLQPAPAGHRAAVDGRDVLGRMLRDLRPVRIEDWDEAGGTVAALMRGLGIRAGAAGPIVITDRGLAAALEGPAKRAPMPVELSVDIRTPLDQRSRRPPTSSSPRRSRTRPSTRRRTPWGWR